jgi:hypothetical protein
VCRDILVNDPSMVLSSLVDGGHYQDLGGPRQPLHRKSPA